MGTTLDVSLALDRTIVPGPVPEPPLERETSNRLEVSVVFTSVAATLAALRQAAGLAHNLGARVTLLVTQLVPQPLPLESPPVLLDFTERRFRLFALESPVETFVRIYLCRDRADALRLMLKPHSMVVIGGPKRWWTSPEQRLARMLRRAGHDVLFVEFE